MSLPTSKDLQELFFRFAATGWVPANWFLRNRPRAEDLPARTGRLRIEIVSHCWQYAHLLDYQLSSLVLSPPRDCDVTVTILHSPEDHRTVKLLDFFGRQHVDHVTWNWQPLAKERLFRRSIGRNLAAKNTSADWIWFTDCDQMFRGDCLNVLNRELQGRRDLMVFPTHGFCTRLLEDENEILTATSEPVVIDIDPQHCEPVVHTRAIGALQIVHGDVARRIGYCDCIPFYQQPVSRWNKAYEDRAFRWLLQTEGTPIDIPGLYRIEHIRKGRYEAADGQPNLARRIAARINPRSIHRIGQGSRKAA